MKKFFPVLLILLLFLLSSFLLKSFIFTKTLFAPEKISTKNFPSLLAKPQTSLIAVGDIMLGRFVNVQILKAKDWRYPFLKTASLTSSADITFGNLEAPFLDNCPTTETGMIFCGRPEAIEGLNFAGFDVLSLANNHILNYDQKGLDFTQKLLSSSDILYSPLTSPKDITKLVKNNLSFGFLSFDLVTYPHFSPIPQISQISPTVDILIVSLHWGTEYQKNPTKEQVELAHQIINAGAKIIIGHHPHVTQPTEEYKNGLIFYSLGNFVFDQSWSEETKKGNIAKIVFEGKNIKSFEEIPVYIEASQPRLTN